MEEQKKKDEEYMKKAILEAQKAFEEDEIPVGAIIVCRDRIISRAHNLTEMLCDVTAHAEMQAITSGANMLGGKYLKDCTLYVTLEPCPMCAGAIVQARVPTVVIGSRNPKAGCAGSVMDLFHQKGLNHQVDLREGILGEICSDLLTNFFLSLRKK